MKYSMSFILESSFISIFISMIMSIIKTSVENILITVYLYKDKHNLYQYCYCHILSPYKEHTFLTKTQPNKV